MSPRVSEAARIFAVAAFLVLIAQGPTFSGHASQLAVANCAKNGAIVQCDEPKVDKKVEVEKGAPTVETKSGGDATKDPCSKENKASNYDAYKKAGCESKGEGKTTFKDENGNEKQVCTTCGGSGAVSEGSGGTSNPSAIDQYTSGDNRPAISQVPVLASPTTADAMNRAFPGVADGTVKLAYPVTPSGQETSNTDGSSSPAPVSPVPGTTLDNSQSVNLNQGTMQNIAALTPPQVRADMPGASSYISPSNGATLGTNGVSVVSAPDSLWKANQELGGVQSPVSPSQVFVQATKNELSADINTAVPRLTDSLTSRSESVAAKVSDAQSKIDDLVAGGISATQTGKLAELSTLKAEVAAGQNELQKITRTYDYLNNSATDPAMFARAYLDPQRQPLLDSFVSRYDAAAQSYSQASAPSAGADSIFGTIAANTTAGQAQQEMSFAQGQISQITGEAPLSDSMRIALQGAPQERTEVGQAYGWLTQQAGLSPADAADCAGTGSCLFRAMAAGAVKSAVDAVVRPVSMIFPSAMPYEMAAQNVQLSPTQQAVQWALDTTVTATNGAAIRALASGEGSIANVAARPVEITASGESGLVIADALPGTRAISFTESTVPITRTGSSYFGDIVPGATPEMGAGKSGASLSIGSDLAVGENVGQVAPDVIKLGSVRPGVQLAEPTGNVGAVTADASAANTLASAASRDWPFAGLPGTREDSGQQQQPPTSVIPQGQAPGDTGGTSDQIASGSEGGAAKGKSAATGDAASSREDGGASPAGVQRVASMVQLPTTPLFSAEDKAAYAEAQARVNTSGKPEWVVLDVGLVEVRPKVSAPEIAQNGVPVGGASNAATNDAQSAVAGPYNGNQIASSQPAPQPTSPAPAAAEPEANAQKPAPPSTVLGNGLGGGVAGNGQGQGAPASGSPDAPPSQSTQEGEQKNPSKTDVAANGATGNGSPTGKNTEGSSAGQGSARGSDQGGQSQTTQGQYAGSMVQGSGQGSATQSAGTSGGGTGVASANKTTPASGQGTAPSQSQPAQETKAAQQKCDDVNANPSKYGAADIENCKSDLEKSLEKIAGVIGGALSAINPFSSTAAQAAPARTPAQLNYNLWGIKAPGGNAAEPAGFETGTLARSLCGGGGLTPREGFQQGGGRLMCNFASPEDAVAAYMSKIDAYCNKLGMCTPKQVVCTWVTGADCDISKLDTAYQNLVNKLGNIDLHNDANKVQFMIAQAVPENSISQFPYSQQQIDAGVQKWRASLGSTAASKSAAPAAAAPSSTPSGAKSNTTVKASVAFAICIGSESCNAPAGAVVITEKQYINPLYQPEIAARLGLSPVDPKHLGAAIYAEFPDERPFTDPTSAVAQQYFDAQVRAAIAAATQGFVFEDNCDNKNVETCRLIADKIRAANSAIKVMVNNAYTQADLKSLASHPAVKVMVAEERNMTLQAAQQIAATLSAEGVPDMPVVFAGAMKNITPDAIAAFKARGWGLSFSTADAAGGGDFKQIVSVIPAIAAGLDIPTATLGGGAYRGGPVAASQLPEGSARVLNGADGKPVNPLNLKRIPVPAGNTALPADVQAYRGQTGTGLAQSEKQQLDKIVADLKAKGYEVKFETRQGSYNRRPEAGELAPAPLNGNVFHQPDDPKQNPVAAFVSKVLNKGSYDTAYAVGIDCSGPKCTFTIATDQNGALVRDNHTAKDAGRISKADLYNWNSIGVSTRGVSGQKLSAAEEQAARDWGESSCAHLGACTNKGHAEVNAKSEGEGVQGAAGASQGAQSAKIAAAQAAATATGAPSGPYAVDAQTNTAFTCDGSIEECQTALRQQVALERCVQAGQCPNDAYFRTLSAERSGDAPNSADAARFAQQHAVERMWQRYLASSQCDSSGCSRWKDELAAQKMGMDLKTYVIGGMKPEFIVQTDRLLSRVEEKYGMQAGKDYDIITAFRDDYRQSLASGSVVARVGYSLHGGSARTGGWGDGQAMDTGCAAGNAGCDNGRFLAAIDAERAALGVARPMPGNDPYHIQYAPTGASQQSYADYVASLSARYTLKDENGNVVAENVVLPNGAIDADGKVSIAVGADGVPLAPNGKPLTGADLPAGTWDGNKLSLADDRPTPPDTRSALEKLRDAAGSAAADAQTKMRDMWKNMFGGGQQPAGGQQGGGGAQPANNSVPANNSRPAGGAAQPSNSGTPAPAPARTGQQPATTANGASGSQTPVVSVSGGNTATGISGERFTCSPGTVVNGSTATPLTIAWTCPAGTTSIGTGFSTLGTNSGSVQLVVSTTSASVNYQLTCQGAQASQTLSCAVQVRHPRVTLVAKPASVESGAPVQLQWSAFDVTSCSLYAPPTVLLVSGGTQGTANTLPLSRSSVFSALCNVGSATTTASVTVLVKGDTAAPLQTVLPR